MSKLFPAGEESPTDWIMDPQHRRAAEKMPDQWKLHELFRTNDGEIHYRFVRFAHDPYEWVEVPNE